MDGKGAKAGWAWEQDFRHLVEALHTGIVIERGTILRPDAVNADGREIDLVRRRCHRGVWGHEIGYAGSYGEPPDAS